MVRPKEIERVGVAGCGLMGSGIAEVCARAELDVKVLEVDDKAVEAGRKRVETSLRRGVGSGKLGEEEALSALEHIGFTTEPHALADRQSVIDAVVESETEKVRVLNCWKR